LQKGLFVEVYAIRNRRLRHMAAWPIGGGGAGFFPGLKT